MRGRSSWLVLLVWGCAGVVTARAAEPPRVFWAAEDASSGEAVARIEGCLGPGLARRTASASCAAEFPWSASRTVCVPRATWEAWLSPRSARDRMPRCGVFRGRWKTVTFLRNLPSDPPKVTRQRFVVSEAERIDDRASWLRVAIERGRARVSRALKDDDPYGVARRLLLAEATPEGKIQDLLRDLGFVHLVTASGIHLYSLQRVSESALAVILGAFATASPRRAIGLARFLSHGLWLGVWLLSGLRAGLLRPWIVVGLRAFARARGFRWHRWAPLGITLAFDGALTAIALLRGVGDEAAAPWSPGTVHYALAVGGGLMAMQAVRDRRGKRPWRWVDSVHEHCALAIGSWWGTAVWDLAATGRIAVATPILSLLVLPTFSLGLYPLLVLAAGGVAAGFQDPALSEALHASSGILNELTRWGASFAAASGSFGSLDSPLAMLLAAFLALGFGGFLPQPRARRTLLGLGVAALLARSLALVWAASSPAPVAEAEAVIQLDVGQGDAALVLSRARGHGLIDVGSERALSEASWVRLLASRGVRRLSWVLLTHLDEDHASGLQRLARVVPIDCVQVPRAELESEAGVRLRAQVPGVAFLTEGCVPFPTWLGSQGKSRDAGGKNSSMFGIGIPLPGNWAYFAFGDADSAMEVSALPALRGWLANQRRLILKVSHHGSRHSSAPAFLASVRAEQAWISSGAGNRFGHPGVEVLQRLTDHRAAVFRTDRLGYLDSRDLVRGAVRSEGARRR